MRTLLLLRVRYLLEQPDRTPLLSEEVIVRGLAGRPAGGDPTWLPDGDALRLLADAQADANVPMSEKRELIATALDGWPACLDTLRDPLAARAAELQRSHRRVRQAIRTNVRGLSVTPQFPPDLLGLLVLQPLV